ncbi:MAG: helix-turn-helix domain-containing protein [Clostridia bacterium]|nr:helix-turn-helix domain-containing protein [Clostridia bacterium]
MDPLSYYYESISDTQNYHSLRCKIKPYAPLHFHSAIELLLVQEGEMLAVINGKEHRVTAGHGCFIDKFSTHTLSETLPNTKVYVCMGNCELFDPVFSDVGGIPPLLFPFSEFDLLNTAIDYYREAPNEALQLAVFKGTIALLLARMAQSIPLLEANNSPASAEICTVLRYINEHFTEDLHLSSLAATFGYSPQYFSRFFHKYMNIHLTEYINIARANYAKRLMDGKKTVAEVAFASGFGSMPTFYRTYKKVFGTLPKG